MRLTEKLKSGNYICGIIKGGFVDKLGKIEDLEEQLGCPLEVLGKALKNGIYRYNKNYEPNFRKEKVLFLGNENGRYYITWLGCWTEYLDNYKKTWWLKEDRSA